MLHPRNKNRGKYNFIALTDSIPELKKYIITNKYGESRLISQIPSAVKSLNQAILNHYYGIKNWDVSN